MQLIADNLACDRGETRIFEGVSFKLKAGEGITVTGPNGSGKSTLLRVIAGLLPAATGLVSVDGTAVAPQSHFLGPDNAMKPNLTVEENLRFWQDFFGGGNLTTLQALGRVGLTHVHQVPFSDLSTGQKRRVAIARLFVAYKPVWLLDEPTSGLDKDAEKTFAGLVDEHLKIGGIVIAATHLPINVDGMKNLRFSERVV